MAETTTALEYQQKALVIHEQIGNKRAIARDHINLASRYKSLKNYSAALEYLQKVETLLQGTDDESSMAYCYSNFAGLYFDLSDFGRSMAYEQKALETNESLEDLAAVAHGYLRIGNIVRTAPDSVLAQSEISPKNRFQTAEQYYQKALALADTIGALVTLTNTWHNLSILHEEAGAYRKAYDAYRTYTALSDSILGEDTKKQITRREIQYEFDKKEATLKYEQQLTQGQLEKQKLLSIQQQQALTISNKEKDLQRLAFLKEKAEKQEKAQQLALAEKDNLLQAADLATLTKEKALQLKTLAQKNALIGFLLAGIAAILLGIAAFYLLLRQRQVKRKAAAQAQYTRQLLENIEEERGRIALDLHDSISHELLGLKQNIRNGSTRRHPIPVIK
ncbi:MAG: hypothetical protein IPM98_19375 [Lewinellaceae bacterium]|nr:hypothetical protein [Lewinellaceae bacterium]